VKTPSKQSLLGKRICNYGGTRAQGGGRTGRPGITRRINASDSADGWKKKKINKLCCVVNGVEKKEFMKRIQGKFLSETQPLPHFEHKKRRKKGPD